MSTPTNATARRIVDRIVDDLRDRHPLRIAWDALDTVAKSAVKKRWVELAAE